MKKSIVFFIGHFLVAAALVCGGESRIEFGRDDAFRGMALLEGLDIVRGVDGTADLILRDRQKGDDTPDIYFDFDEEPIRDSGSGAAVRNENNAVIISRSHKMRGKGSAAFQYGARLLVEPKGGSLFPSGTMSEDFTIQFWMYPATLGEGEIIFRWENTSADLAEKGSPVYQEISCGISGRVLVWVFTNFFQNPGEEAKTLSLRG
ncbi:MAG: hypothetical protein FWG35_01300, partial [Spirochaetaceae bacterium]|nr:hypothetical protein [Spirochaetaceae bacterium]